VILIVSLAASAVAMAGASRPYVRLAGSWLDHQRYEWAVFAHRPGPPEGSGPHGAQRPCITVGVRERIGKDSRVSENLLCYGLPQFLSATSEPLIVSETIFADDTGSATAFGVAAPHAARRLMLTVPGGSRTVRLRPLSRDKARLARLRPFRYAGFVLRGSPCIERVLVLNREGEALSDNGLEPCP
jgi:hypothetical protein